MPDRFDFQPRASGYSHENAFWLGRFASLAYHRPRRVEAAVRSLGMSRFHFITGRRHGTQAFVAGDRERIVVAFRGTQPERYEDWLTDLRIRLVDGVHRGFRMALDEVWTEVLRAMERSKGRPLTFADVAAGRPVREGPALWFTGHSLGAALATLAADRLVAEDWPVEGLYTFGQPRTGSREWAARFDRDFGHRTFRFVNNNDLVTRVPPRSLGYSHVGTFRYFDAGGRMHEGIGWWRRFLDRVQGRIEDLTELGPDGLRDHDMSGYLAGLARQRGG